MECILRHDPTLRYITSFHQCPAMLLSDSGYELVAHKSSPALSTDDLKSAQPTVTAMVRGETLGLAEAQVIPAVAAGADHPAAAITP